MGVKIKDYSIGDIIAIKISDIKAISCLAVNYGEGIARNGKVLRFDAEDVLWRLGNNGRWPGWVHRMFRGESEEIVDADARDETC